MRGRPQQLILHILACTVFLALPFLFSPESLNLHSYLTNPPTQRDIISYVLLLGVFYSNYYLLIPRLYFRRKYAAFIFLNLLGVALVTFLPFALLPHHGPFPVGGFRQDGFRPPHPPPFDPGSHRPPPIHMIINEHFFLFLVVLFLALLLKIRDRWISAEDEKLHAELSYLKAQINPHFLFNTLNSIYAMALHRSEQTAEAIVQLSSMMRYVLVEAGKDKVLLEKELTYLMDYIQLQRSRFEGSLNVDLQVNGNPEGKQLYPLLLIPFVENAFKYGVNPEQPSTIGIRIEIGDDGLRLQVSNNKVAVIPADTPGGLGISNTRRRLQLLYPGQHSLLIEDEPKTFLVSLNLSGL